jgi:hypothetical protein
MVYRGLLRLFPGTERVAREVSSCAVSWRGGRVAEGGGLLNRYRALKPYRGFESPLLRPNT